MSQAPPDATAGGEWTPEFPGQRAPFAPGNEAAVVHGGHSERSVAPLAAQIAQELLENAETPEHLREPMFAPAVQAWARAEAVAELLFRHLSGLDLQAAMTDLTTADEEERTTKSKTTRRSTTRRTTAAHDQWHRASAHAASLRSKLGLDPASAARVGRDLAARRYLDGATPLSAALETMEKRRALTAGGDGG